MHEDRLHNAAMALEVLARADSAAFARARNDGMSTEEWSRLKAKLARGMPLTTYEQDQWNYWKDRMAARGDAAASNWRASYVTKDGTPRTVTVMALDAAGAKRLVAKMSDFASDAGEPTALRSDDAGRSDAEDPKLWAAFREKFGPRPGGRGAQERWEAQWERFQKEHASGRI